MWLTKIGQVFINAGILSMAELEHLIYFIYRNVSSCPN